MKISSSESEKYWKDQEKGLINSLGFKEKVTPHKCKKVIYAIINVSNKDLPKTIREFEKLLYRIYENKRPKHEPTDSYFYLSRPLAKCTMRSDALNLHGYPVRTRMTDTKHIPTLHVCSTHKSKL